MLNLNAVLKAGTIDAVRLTGGEKCSIVWRSPDGTRECWLDEVRVAGRKRALYAFHRNVSQGVLRKIARFESDEAHYAALRAEREDAHLRAVAAELGIELGERVEFVDPIAQMDAIANGDDDGIEPDEDMIHAQRIAVLG